MLHNITGYFRYAKRLVQMPIFLVTLGLLLVELVPLPQPARAQAADQQRGAYARQTADDITSPFAALEALRTEAREMFFHAGGFCALVINLAAHLAAPAGLNAKVLGPLLLYSCRLCAFGRLTLRGPGAAPPESSLRVLLRHHPLAALVHVILFASMLGATSHEVDARVELAACLLEAACALTCLSWHGAKVPGGPPHLAALLAGRALVPLVNLGLAYAVGRWRPAWGLLGAGRRKGAAKSAAASEGLRAAGQVQATQASDVQLTRAATAAAAAAQGTSEPDHPAAACPWGSSSVSSGIGMCDHCRPRSELTVDGAPGRLPASGGRPLQQQQGVSLLLPVTPGCTGYPAAPATPAAAEAIARAVNGSASSAAAAGATDAASQRQEEEATEVAVQPPGASNQQPSVAEDVAEALRMGMQQRLARRTAGRPQPVYRPFLRVTTCHYKIPWAEPEDIASGFEERLAALCEARGRVLTGVYVRAGCIELSFVLAERAGAGHQQQQLMPAAAGNGGHGDYANRLDDGDGDGGDISGLLSPEEILEALGLLPPGSSCGSSAGIAAPAAAGSSTSSASSSNTSSGSAGSSAGLHAVAAGSAPQHPRALHIARMISTQRNGPSVRARVVNVSPRVLLLPPSEQPPEADATSASAPVLRLRVAFGGGAGPAAADDVVVRGGGGYLAARVAAKQLSAAEDAAGEAGAAPAQEWEYAIQLVEPPPHAQLLTVQLAFPAAATAAAGGGDTHNTPVQWLSVPVLAVDDSAVAAELGAALQQLQQQDTSSACMEELVCDLGQWLAFASGANEDGWAEGAGCRYSIEWVAELGAHLLQYAEGAGLVATAARIRAGGHESSEAAKALESDGAAESKRTNKHGAGAQGLRRRGLPSKAAEGNEKGAGCSDWAPGDSSNPADAAGSTSRENGLQEYMEAWIVTMCKTCQMVECLVALSFAALGLKANQPLWSAESAVVYAGLGMGTVTTLAGLWMTPRAWSRLALAARVPRFLGFMTAKLLLSAGVLPPPVGAATYAGGPGILLLEGVILPSGCLLPPRTALLMSCLKLPLNLMSGLAVGAFDGPLPAALMALAVEAAALGTTLACHAYVRRRYEGINRREA